MFSVRRLVGLALSIVRRGLSVLLRHFLIFVRVLVLRCAQSMGMNRMKSNEVYTTNAFSKAFGWAIAEHPLPWHVEDDWAFDIIASDGHRVGTATEREIAEAMIAYAEKLAE